MLLLMMMMAMMMMTLMMMMMMMTMMATWMVGGRGIEGKDCLHLCNISFPPMSIEPSGEVGIGPRDGDHDYYDDDDDDYDDYEW